MDTHIAVWAALDPACLNAAERRHMARDETSLFLSAVSIWELRLKWQSLHMSGERKGPGDPTFLFAFARAMDWELLSLTPSHAAAVLSHPLSHKDPFDELLLVQAQEEGMRLLTRDSNLIQHALSLGA